MPVTIGGKPESTFDDPVGLLGDCHRRIERFLAALATVARDAGGGHLSAGQRSTWETALRYFRESAPKHTADEEESLFPRLRSQNRPHVNAMLARVAELEEDHRRADDAHAEVDRLGRLWLERGSLAEEESSRLAALLGELTELYGRHIAVEDGEVFPLAASVLTAEERKAIGREMASRRGLRPPS